MAIKLLSFLLLSVTTIASSNYTSNPRNSSLIALTGTPPPDLADTLCPTWFTPALINDSVWCECNTDRVQQGLVLKCPSQDKICVKNCTHQEHYSTDALNVSILTGFCMTHSFKTQQTLLALCPYNTHQANSSNFFITLPSEVPELNFFMCRRVRREGDLCSRCVNSTGPSIHNSGKVCLHLSNLALKWPAFVLIEVILPTVFFFSVLFCKVRATSGPLNALIFFCQMLSCLVEQERSYLEASLGYYSSDQRNISTSEEVRIVIMELIGTFYGFWNNQLLLFISFSVSSSISVIQVIASEYVSALLPFFLVVLSWTFITLYNRMQKFRLVAFSRKLFLRCLRKLKVWDPIDSIIQAFATFILLSYTKVIVVSLKLLAPTIAYNQSGPLDYKIMPYDASIHFLSKGHLPYFVLAVFMLTAFCVVPFLVLCLHPMACFQDLLDQLKISGRAQIRLRTFIDAYTSCYIDPTDTPSKKDFRYFASLYFLIRFIFLSFAFFIKYSYMWLSLILLSLAISALFLTLRPYREDWLNVVDGISFLLAAIAFLLYTCNIYVTRIPIWFTDVFFFIPFLYFVVFVSYKIYAKLVVKCRRKRGGRQEEEEGSVLGCVAQQEGEYSAATPLLTPLNSRGL